MASQPPTQQSQMPSAPNGSAGFPPPSSLVNGTGHSPAIAAGSLTTPAGSRFPQPVTPSFGSLGNVQASNQQWLRAPNIPGQSSAFTPVTHTTSPMISQPHFGPPASSTGVPPTLPAQPQHMTRPPITPITSPASSGILST